MAVAALTGALVEAPTWGWTSPRIGALVLLAVVGTAVFVRRCQRHANPMLELQLLRVRRFAVANAGVFVFSAAFAIMLLSNALWCQDVWHYSALRTGLAMAPGPAMVPFVTFASARLVHRVGSGPVAAAGGVLFAASFLWRVGLAGPTPNYAADLLPSMIVGGIAVGLALSTLIAAGATSLPVHRSATGSAIVNSTRQVASALGVAVLVTVLGPHVGGSGASSAFDRAWVVAAVLSVAAAAVSVVLPPIAPLTPPASQIRVDSDAAGVKGGR